VHVVRGLSVAVLVWKVVGGLASVYITALARALNPIRRR
jgi:hypothetical protein